MMGKSGKGHAKYGLLQWHNKTDGIPTIRSTDINAQ